MTDTGAGTPLRDALDVAERIDRSAKDHPKQLVEVSQALFHDQIVRPLRQAAARSRPATDPAGLDVERLAQAVFDYPGSLAAKSWRTYPEAEAFAAAILARLSVADGPGPEERLREAGDGYEVLTWVDHQPSGKVVLAGHPQLGGRYCLTDGGDWPCGAVSAALPEHREETGRS